MGVESGESTEEDNVALERSGEPDQWCRRDLVRRTGTKLHETFCCTQNDAK